MLAELLMESWCPVTPWIDLVFVGFVGIWYLLMKESETIDKPAPVSASIRAGWSCTVPESSNTAFPPLVAKHT